MKVCPACHHENLAKALACRKCGHLLLPEPPKEAPTSRLLEVSTRKVKQEEAPPMPPADQGTKTFGENAELLLEFPEGVSQVVLLSDGAEVTIGRVDRFTSVLPTINLTHLRAWEKGVSRLHVAIHRTGENLYVVDLDSTNGTFLNGERIPSHKPQLLHHGDRIRLGLFDFRLCFVKEMETEQAAG